MAFSTAEKTEIDDIVAKATVAASGDTGAYFEVFNVVPEEFSLSDEALEEAVRRLGERGLRAFVVEKGIRVTGRL